MPDAVAEVGARLWDKMLLDSTDDLVEQKLGSTSSGLNHALATIESGAISIAPNKVGGGRAVPSAGAIYPYEFYIIAEENGKPSVLRADPVQRLCCRIDVSGEAVLAQCELAGLATPTTDNALVLVVNRPWLSIRKYDDRGYLYSQLDTAHVAANLLGIASFDDNAAELRIRFDRKPLEDLLGLSGQCREIHSALCVRRAGEDASPDSWAVRDLRFSGLGSTSWLERTCWEAFTPLLVEDSLPAQPYHGPSAMVRLRDQALLDQSVSLTSRWSQLTKVRASSRDFKPASVPHSVIWRVLATSGVPLATDLPTDDDLRLTLVARSIDDMPPGAYPLTGLAERQLVVLSGRDVVRACMYQEHLAHSAAVVLFHAPRKQLVGRRLSGMREMLFRVGAVSQLLYLGATDIGLGVTGIGGFDVALWRRLAGLPEDHELLYVMCFGHNGDSNVKWDRMEVAYAQNER